MFLVAGLLLFILLIVLHEYGHFLVAKRNKVEVEEFGIFFPPKLWGKKMGQGIFEGYYTLNMLPLGGFVKLKGENNQDKRKGSYGASSFWVKTKITLAGVATNYLVACLLLSVVAFNGLPKFFDNQRSVSATTVLGETVVVVGDLSEGLPAEVAGLEKQDVITVFAGQAVSKTAELIQLIEENQGETVSIEYKDFSDSDALKESTIKVRSENKDEEGLIGAGLFELNTEYDRLESPAWAAPINGLLLANQLGIETFKSVGSAIGSLSEGDTESATENVAGPVGIVNFLANDVSDFETLIIITANISMALAVANLLPIPGLDGGRFYTIAIFKLLNKELTEETEQKINAVGVVILLTLVVLITISDVGKL